MRKEVFEIEFDYLPFWLSIFKRLCRAEKREQNLTREERFKSHMLVGGKNTERESPNPKPIADSAQPFAQKKEDLQSKQKKA